MTRGVHEGKMYDVDEGGLTGGGDDPYSVRGAPLVAPNPIPDRERARDTRVDE